MSEALGRYLRPGPVQQRVVAAMTSGHARAKHGAELGHPTAQAYAARLREHLRVAPTAVAVTDPEGRDRLLVADARTNQVAWITPHREQRSTFFQPRRGVDAYIRVQRAISPPGRWRPLDAGAARQTRARRTAHRTASAARQPPVVDLGR